MIELLHSPFRSVFKNFAENIRHTCLICSPYIKLAPVRTLSQVLCEKKLADTAEINVVTDISLRTVLQGATDISALLYLLKNHPRTTVTYLPRIHAKVYIADGAMAIITSANFTEGGETRNFEYGVQLNDAVSIQKVQTDIDEYKKLGARVSETELLQIQAQVENLSHAIRTEQKSLAQKIKTESQKHRVIIENNLIRVRVKGTTINAIFSDTLLYLLSQKPMSTEELHQRIKDIHPDLCDDDLDRVIDGKHFGKLWKHQVRNAQVYLRRSGLIAYNSQTRMWQKR